MAVKTVIDGVLLADCERIGPIRFGVARLAEEVTARLLNDSEIDLYIANTRQTVDDDRLMRSHLSKLGKTNFRILSYPFEGTNLSTVERVSAKLFRELYPGAIRGINNYNVFHSFYYPFSERLMKTNIPKSITILDIIPLRIDGYPKEFNLMKSIVESIIPNFGIAISQFSKDDLCDYEKRIDPARIFVIPLAANRELFYMNKNRDTWQKVKDKYSLPDNYFLSISGTDKRKNLQHLMYAFNKLVLQEKIEDLHLVMTSNAPFDRSVFERMNIDKKTREQIVFTRSIEEVDLSAVYSNALCFFFMSLYEGFGLPVLEAMQCGTPVITSNVTSLPEVAGDAGITLPPHDIDALCSAMLRIYSDSELRKDLSVRGLRRAAEFSWDRCADEHAAIFKKIGYSTQGNA